MPIIYNSNFATGAGAAMREFKDVNQSYRNTMLKLEGMRRQEEENEARRQQQLSMQRERLEQNQAQFDAQMDFKQQQFAGSQSRVGDTFAEVTGEGILGTYQDLTGIALGAQREGRLLADAENQAQFGALLTGLLGREVTPDTPITPQELDEHPNKRAIYSAVTGKYNELATLDAQQQLTDIYGGTAETLMEQHPEFAQTPAGLAILDSMSAAYSDALQEDVLNTQAAQVEAAALKRSFIAGASRQKAITETRLEVHAAMADRRVPLRQREQVEDVLSRLDQAKFSGSVDDVRIEALSIIDPDMARARQLGNEDAMINASAAAAAGAVRQQAQPPRAPVAAPEPPASERPALGTKLEQQLSNRSDQQQAMLDFMLQDGVEFLYDAEENEYVPADRDAFRASAARYKAQRQQEAEERKLAQRPMPDLGMDMIGGRSIATAPPVQQAAPAAEPQQVEQAEPQPAEVDEQALAIEEAISSMALQPQEQELARVLMQIGVEFEVDADTETIIDTPRIRAIRALQNVNR